MFHIKINSSEENKDKGFFTLMNSGSSIICLDDEEYVVPKEAVSKLNKKDVKYEIVVEEKEAEKDTKEKVKDAPKTKI